MHEANRKAWRYFKNKYPNYFQGQISVLEVGSYDVNGTVREHFDAAKYVGVDWRPGPLVDVVCLAHDMAFEEKFNTVISASMLEHDPYWRLSIKAMVAQLKDDGALMLSWGAALNPPHEHATAPDCKFHCLPAELVINLLGSLGLHVHEFHYEINIPGVVREDCVCGSGWGEVVLLAVKNRTKAVGEPLLDELLKEDIVGLSMA